VAILNFPPVVISSCDWGIESNTQVFDSPLNRKAQTLSLPGDRWLAVITFDLLHGDDARLVRAFLGALRGRAGRFYFGPPDYTTPAGTALGTPLCKGAGTSGSMTLLTDGWTANQTAALKAGDYIQVGTQLRMLTADAPSNSIGEATLQLDAPLREAPADNAPIVTSSPKGVFKLVDDKQAMWQINMPVVYGFSFAIEEALDI
jgi:hypothetical protein